jgi:hypothetical protein
MKHLFLFGAIIILFTCCIKETQVESVLKANPLIGTWELRSIYGVQDPGAPSQFAPGNKNIITFTESHIAFYHADTLVREEEEYSLVIDTCWEVQNPPKMLPRFVNENVTDGSGVFLEVESDQLTIYYHLLAAGGRHERYARLD